MILKLAIPALVILVFLMLARPGVTVEDLGSYLASGFIFEIVWVVFCGIVITAIHYVTFQPNMLHLQEYCFYQQIESCR